MRRWSFENFPDLSLPPCIGVCAHSTLSGFVEISHCFASCTCPCVVAYHLAQITTNGRQVKTWIMELFFVYFFGKLECVSHSFAYVAHFYFWEISGFEPRKLLYRQALYQLSHPSPFNYSWIPLAHFDSFLSSRLTITVPVFRNRPFDNNSNVWFILPIILHKCSIFWPKFLLAWFLLSVKPLTVITSDFTVPAHVNITGHWSTDRFACIDGLMFLMHTRLALSRSGRWLVLYGKILVTLLYWYRQINWHWSIDRLACIDWLIDLHALVDWCFFIHTGLAVSRSGRWLALYRKKLVTLLYWCRQINWQWTIDRLACNDWLIDLHALIDWCSLCTQGWQWAAVAAGWLSMERNLCLYCTGILVQTNKLAVIEWSIGMQWLIDRLACIDWLMFLLMHAGLAVSRSGR